MASLFRYPLTLGSKKEAEGNHHIITFVALKYNENKGTTTPGSEVNLYITGDALKSTYGQVYADVAIGAVGGALMQSSGTDKMYAAIEQGAGALGSLATGGEGGFLDAFKNLGGGGGPGGMGPGGPGRGPGNGPGPASGPGGRGPGNGGGGPGGK